MWRRAGSPLFASAVVSQDRDVEGGQRWQLTGWAEKILLVAYALARRATPQERSLYEENEGRY
jgi:uncharacterized DUF497 family protein